jgi:CBS domain-containing protein
MNAVKPVQHSGRLTLHAETAADLMTANPISIRGDATVREAVALLSDKGISAAPVIDAVGRPVGVLSRADILIHDREKKPTAEYYQHADLEVGQSGVPFTEGAADMDVTRVREIMTPAVFSVTPEAPVRRVVGDMAALRVHRLFVVDRSGILVGVISALDVLKFLQE